MSTYRRIAVVGATGQVGRLMLQLLAERSFPAQEIVPFASERSVGMRLEGLDVPVQALSEQAIKGFDLALFSAGGDTSGEWAPRFAANGAVVIDNSSRWRMDANVPLVVSEVNPGDLEAIIEARRQSGETRPGAIVANPNCSTMQMVVALKPLHDAARIRRLVISTYQAVSGTGKHAVQELERQAAAVLSARAGGMSQAELPSGVYPHQIAFNVLPHAGSFAAGDDHTDEERKLINETRKILSAPEIEISATCARVPVFIGHSEAVNVEFHEPLSADRARALLSSAAGLRVVDDPDRALYPLATEAQGADDVLVGRIRQDAGRASALDLWIVADNLRKGAATNAVQIAELLGAAELTPA